MIRIVVEVEAGGVDESGVDEIGVEELLAAAFERRGGARVVWIDVRGEATTNETVGLTGWMICG